MYRLSLQGGLLMYACMTIVNSRCGCTQSEPVKRWHLSSWPLEFPAAARQDNASTLVGENVLLDTVAMKAVGLAGTAHAVGKAHVALVCMRCLHPLP